MKHWKAILAAAMMLAMLLSLFMPGMAFAEEKTDEITAPEVPEGMTAAEMAAQAGDSIPLSNRFNVMMVLDASASMGYTDRGGYRFDAMKLFTNLMADEGNVLGGEVFSTGIDLPGKLSPVNGQREKDKIVDAMKNVQYPGGWTNIGGGLTDAVGVLKDRNQELDSVIILLTDGITAMPDRALEEESFRLEDIAIKWLKENNIPVYCVCLNAEGSSNISELERISEETDGKCVQIRQAKDLNNVFKDFYKLIYGVKTRVDLSVDTVFPEEGSLETPFDVPGFAVEEVNIVIQGKTTDIRLVQPSGREGYADRHDYDSFTALKISGSDLVPGMWTLVTEGVPGDAIQIEVIYNNNLKAELFNDEKTVVSKTLPTDKPVMFYTKLATDTAEAEKLEYYGFDAELAVLNDLEEEIDRVPMAVGMECFEAGVTLEPGEYYFVTTVTGPNLSKDSNMIGPLTFKAADEPEPKPEPVNTAPTASQSSLKKTVFIWPFAGGKWVENVGALVKDKEDPVLKYSIAESSFYKNASCTVDAGGTVTLKLGNFHRFGKGSVTVRATDSKGLYCDVRLQATVINTVFILLGLLAVAAIAGLVYWLINRGQGSGSTPARGGNIIVSSDINGLVRTSSPYKAGKGRILLSHFQGIDNIGLDYSRCYFEGANDTFVFLTTEKPVRWRGTETKEVRIDTGVETSIYVGDDEDKKLLIRYDADRTGR
ncbi:MAG: VWA domain-containing protein [Oscillospiraceae bacterium]|nr:VWA domain-containing protein [Oscillospiraceae bacterium]